MSERLTDERVRWIAEQFEDAPPNVPGPWGHEIVALAREVLAARAGDREERPNPLFGMRVLVMDLVPKNEIWIGTKVNAGEWNEALQLVKIAMDRAAPGGETRAEG